MSFSCPLKTCNPPKATTWKILGSLPCSVIGLRVRFSPITLICDLLFFASLIQSTPVIQIG